MVFLFHSVAEVKPDAEITKSDPVTSSQKIIIKYQRPNTHVIVNDDLENLKYESGPNSCTSHINMNILDNYIHSIPADCDGSEKNRSTVVYSDPWISSSIPKNLVGPSGDIYSEANRPFREKKLD